MYVFIAYLLLVSVTGFTSPSQGDGLCTGPTVNVDWKFCNDKFGFVESDVY